MTLCPSSCCAVWWSFCVYFKQTPLINKAAKRTLIPLYPNQVYKLTAWSHLPLVEDRLRVDDGLRAELSQRHQTLHVIVEANNAAKVLDADDVAVGDAAGEGVMVAEE